MALNKDLLSRVMRLTNKEAYVPPGAPPMDPAAMGGMPPGGAPPMDPAMMGGAPPMDPAMGGAPPMDPAMMGGAPPMDPAMMDPAMMGGAPPMDPAMMDPAMAGGMPPGDPAAGGMPVMLNMADLEAILAQSGGGGGEAPEDSKRVTNKDIGDRLDQLEMIIAEVANFMGVPLPEGGVGAPMEMGEAPPMQEEAPSTQPFTEPAEAAAGPAGMPEPVGGLMPGSMSDASMLPPASVKTASEAEGLADLQARISMLNSYR